MTRFYLLLALLGLGLAGPAGAAESIEVGLGRATTIKIPAGARQVVVGNPTIADVTLQSGRSLTLFGKYPGGTSLSVIDGSGRVVMDRVVVVTAGGAESVTVRYGTGKGWVPGGQVTVAECSTERCSPTMPLPTEGAYKTGK